MIKIIPTILKRSDVLMQILSALLGTWGNEDNNAGKTYYLGKIVITMVSGSKVKNPSKSNALLIMLEGSTLKGYMLTSEAEKAVSGSIGILISDF